MRCQHVNVHARVEPGHVGTTTEEAHAGRFGAGAVVGAERVALLVVGVADDREAQPRHVRVEQAEPLRRPRGSPSPARGAQPARPPRRRARCAPSSARAARASSTGIVAGSNRRQIDAVAEQRELAPRNPKAASVSRSSGFCTSSACAHSSATRSIEYTTARRPQRILALCVQAVHGVHDHRHAGEPGRDPAVEARLRVVRVHDRGPEPAEDRDELGHRARVVHAARTIASSVVERHVTDAAGLERLDVGPGRRHAHHFETAAANASSCGPSSNSRLMSVVVTCTTSGDRLRSRGRLRVANPVHRATERVLERHPARELACEELHAVAHLDRRTREPVRDRFRATGSLVCPRARRSENDPARAGRPPGEPATAFGYAKSRAVWPRWAPIRSIDRSSSSAASADAMRSNNRCVSVCDPMSTSPVAHASRSADHETGRPLPGQHARSPSTNVGREIERRRNLVPHEDRQRHLDEVGGPVVERHDDRRLRVSRPPAAAAAS